MIKKSSLCSNSPSCSPLQCTKIPWESWVAAQMLFNTQISKEENILLKSRLMYPFSLPVYLVHSSKLSRWWITELSGFHVCITLKLRAANSNVSGLRACQSRQKMCSDVSFHCNWYHYTQHFVLHLLSYRINQRWWAKLGLYNHLHHQTSEPWASLLDFSNCSLLECKW